MRWGNEWGVQSREGARVAGAGLAGSWRGEAGAVGVEGVRGSPGPEACASGTGVGAEVDVRLGARGVAGGIPVWPQAITKRTSSSPTVE